MVIVFRQQWDTKVTVFLSVFSNTFGEQLIQFSRYPNVLLMRFCSIIEVGPTPKPQPQVMCIMTPDKDCEEGKWERQCDLRNKTLPKPKYPHTNRR